MKKITIAIDGFSSCGKSTMAKDLAKEIGYIYIDSGAMYRAVTLYSIENGIFHGDTIDTDELKRRIGDIHISFRIDPETGRPNTYLNGVNVENKIRTMEVSSKVSPISALGFVREAMVAQQQEMGKAKGIVMDGRDHIHQTREVSPFKKADDALLLDNSHLTIAEQKEWLMAEYQKAIKA